MSEPEHEFLRREEVMAWLEEKPVGIRRAQTRKLMEEDVIKGAPLPGKKNGRDYYRRSQIKKDLGL